MTVFGEERTLPRNDSLVTNSTVQHEPGFERPPMVRATKRGFSKKWIVLGLVLFTGILLYLGLFVLPRTVQFAYSADTCKTELTFLPSLQKSAHDTSFKFSYQKVAHVGSLSIAASKTCFTPVEAPKQGNVKLAIAPSGGWLFRAKYNVKVGEAPKVHARVSAAPQAMTKPVKLQMSQPDKVFQYHVASKGKSQQCNLAQTEVTCNFDKLGLAQGATHPLEFHRTFDNKKVEAVAQAQITILSAAKVTDSSIKHDAVVFTKPKSLVLTFDKTLRSTRAKLEQLDGAKQTVIELQTKITDKQVEFSWVQDLPREKFFKLTILAAEADDGSTLAEPHVIGFRTSGGPRVTGVNIPASGAAGNVRAVVTFDQPLAPGLDITKFASIAGGPAAVSYKGNQVVFQLQGVELCTAFTLNIAAGLTGENGVVSNTPWSFGSRVACGWSKVIGYSVQGKPIIAYFFGSGPSSVLFTGGIHGNEPSSVYLLDDFVAHLRQEAYKIPTGRQIVIVPNLNPDGIAINQRYNMHNVNLDRNFATSDWVSDIPVKNGEIVAGGGGSAPLSEPETQAIAGLTSSLQLRAMISFHARGSLVGINEVADSDVIGNLYASGVGYQKMFYNAEDVMGHDFTGEYEIWIGEKLGKPAVLVELPDYKGRYFARHKNTLWQMIGL